MHAISGTALSWFSSYLTINTVNHRRWPCLTSLNKPFLWCATGYRVGPISLHPLHETSFWHDQSHSSESQSFADDTQLQVSVPPPNIQSAISFMKTCLSDIQTWMLENKLKLNNDETEALLVRSSSKSFSICLWLWNLFFFFCWKSWFLPRRKHECRTAHKECLPIGILWTSLYQNNLDFFSRWLYKNTCVCLCPL